MLTSVLTGLHQGSNEHAVSAGKELHRRLDGFWNMSELPVMRSSLLATIASGIRVM
jgi:hypothetical protein